jgi:hypothetical protein
VKQNEIRSQAIEVRLNIDLPLLRKVGIEEFEDTPFALFQRLPKRCEV